MTAGNTIQTTSVQITHDFVLCCTMQIMLWYYTNHAAPTGISAGNSGQPKTPDTWYISVMDKSFGLKISVLKHFPLGYIHTKSELKTQLKATGL